MRTILVPVDFSDVTLRVVKAAAHLAKPFGSRLILVHVTDGHPEYQDGGLQESLGPLGGHLRLAELRELVGSIGLESTTLELIGPPVEGIIGQAESARVDLIVLGTHGRGPLYHLFAGGVLDGILRRARCPVLVVPLAGGGPQEGLT